MNPIDKTGKAKISLKFLVKNDLKQEAALSSFLFNFTLEYAFRKFRQIGSAWNLMVHTSVCVMPMMLLYWVEAYNVQIKHESFSSQRIGLEANAGKTKWSYMVMARDQVAGQFHAIKIDKKTF